MKEIGKIDVEFTYCDTCKVVIRARFGEYTVNEYSVNNYSITEEPNAVQCLECGKDFCYICKEEHTVPYMSYDYEDDEDRSAHYCKSCDKELEESGRCLLYDLYRKIANLILEMEESRRKYNRSLAYFEQRLKEEYALKCHSKTTQEA